ncbi:hypothetical protein [Amycolatopsis nigrescens]|uniref:hypothetical protein n=1 Tax=Amycolatopsis nigrescens TaxID=381445 RepID=UPI00037701EE|nr:hypothetical protein [Amycolatopsis nigrescens]
MPHARIERRARPYEPLWTELDSRDAVVFAHPTEPPIPQLAGLPSPLLGFPFDTMAGLRRFYFDTACPPAPTALPSLLAFAEPGHILYSSDFPFAPAEWRADFDHCLTTYDGPDGVLHAAKSRIAGAMPPSLSACDASTTRTSPARSSASAT